MNETQHLTLARKEHFLLQIVRKKCMNAMSYRYYTVYMYLTNAQSGVSMSICYRITLLILLL